MTLGSGYLVYVNIDETNFVSLRSLHSSFTRDQVQVPEVTCQTFL